MAYLIYNVTLQTRQSCENLKAPNKIKKLTWPFSINIPAGEGLCEESYVGV